MRSLYDFEAAKEAVDITLNSDLYSRARALGVDLSQVVEMALAREVARLSVKKLEAEIREDIEALDAYEAEHGSFVAMACEHYRSATNDEYGR